MTTEPGNPVPRPDSASRPAGKFPSALNLPNLITLSRLLLAIVLFALIDFGGHWVAATAVFLVAAATDFLDGMIARKYGLVTKVGRILDPFVDKVIIGGAFLFLAMHRDNGSGVNAWMVITVIGREMFVTSLRSVLEQEGKDFSAVMSGKIKMTLQCAAVVGSLLFLAFGHGTANEVSFGYIRDGLLWAAVLVTVYSGYEYVIRAIHLFRAG
ncbi:MAG: CDP-diacylglycerol--glycerol-3-phosphate 3-phosphatidyltransferase [Planctomycetes bacterium]|nr:CDP-diacylglycerol--glycerol-3-phosphate 3-phosphatidyltransferase [Planctomycetota bacterium]